MILGAAADATRMAVMMNDMLRKGVSPNKIEAVITGQTGYPLSPLSRIVLDTLVNIER